MKKASNIVLSDKILRLSVALSSIGLLMITTLVIINYTKLPPYVPFFNSMPWGVERLFPSYIVLSLPVLVLMVIVGNNILSVLLYTKHTLIARMLSFNGLIFVFLGMLAYLQILFLVF